MSRHKLVKKIDLDEELDDYEGAESEDYDSTEELTEEDRIQLAHGLQQVRDIIGHDVDGVTDKRIEESLYYYYYDVSKTVNYILNQSANNASQEAKSKQTSSPNAVTKEIVKSAAAASHAPPPEACDWSAELMATITPHLDLPKVDFFHDTPWLAVAKERLCEFKVEPVRPRGGLLGGSSGGAPKSKLAALAAARRKGNESGKSQARASASAGLLDTLGSRNGNSRPLRSPSSAEASPALPDVDTPTPRKRYPVRERRPSSPPSLQPPTESMEICDDSTVPASKTHHAPKALTSNPSDFAKIMLGNVTPAAGNDHNRSLHSTLFSSLAVPSMGFQADGTAFAGPSPDDVVLKAQTVSKAVPNTEGTSRSKKPGATEQATQGVKDLSIAPELVKDKSEHIDVKAEYSKTQRKNAAAFVVIGHVDAGKSTIMGRLLHDLKAVDQRTIDKYRKEAEQKGKGSFALAWVLDQGTEERERGVTIDVANRHFETGRTDFTILDAPGHRDFIPNMIAGASQADFAVLVCDASTGNFESGLRGQTREHTLLARSIGIQHIIIAVNKLDSVQWSKERFDEIKQQVTAFLTAAGFAAKALVFVPCSGLTGDNVTRQSTDSSSRWYKGPTLLEALEINADSASTSETHTAALSCPLRLTIEDVFRGGLQNPLSISGRIDSGIVQVGEAVIIMPAAQMASIKGIDVEDKPQGQAASGQVHVRAWAVASQNVILHLAEIEAKYIRPGDLLCPAAAPIACPTRFRVKLLAFEHILPSHCEVLKGRLRAPAKIVTLEAVLDKATGQVAEQDRGKKARKPKVIRPGSLARVLVEMEQEDANALAAKEGGDDLGYSGRGGIPMEAGNRVILRASGETIGAGIVE